MNYIERARTAFERDRFSCAQATFLACSERFGIEPELALKAAGAFGGGIAKSGETCGAVSGVLMGLGLKYAMTKPGDTQTKDRMYEIATEFMKRFSARKGALKCNELLGCDYSTPEGRRYAAENDLHARVCSGLVQAAVEIFNEMMEEDP